MIDSIERQTDILCGILASCHIDLILGDLTCFLRERHGPKQCMLLCKDTDTKLGNAEMWSIIREGERGRERVCEY